MRRFFIGFVLFAIAFNTQAVAQNAVTAEDFQTRLKPVKNDKADNELLNLRKER